MNNSIKDLKLIKTNLAIRNFLSSALIGVLVANLIRVIHSNTDNMIFVIGGIMFVAVVGLGLCFQISQIRKISAKRKYNKIKKEIIEDSVRLARQKNDYSNLNSILGDEDNYQYIMEVCYFINMHNNGNWINKEKLVYPDCWGNSFFEKASLFFKNNKLEYKELSESINISTFLATVKPEIVKEIVEKTEGLS